MHKPRGRAITCSCSFFSKKKELAVAAGGSCTPPSAAGGRRAAWRKPSGGLAYFHAVFFLLSLFFFLPSPPPPTGPPSPSPILPLRPVPSLDSPLSGSLLSDAGELPTPHNPKFLSLLRRLHHGQPRRQRLRGAAASPAHLPHLPHLRWLPRRSSSPSPTVGGPGPSPHACLQRYAARGVCAAEGGV
jgi:hypothetical protein